MVKKLQLLLVAIFCMAFASQIEAQQTIELAHKQKDLGNYSQAITAYEDVLKNHPNHSEAKANLAWIHSKLQNFNQAVDYYQDLMDQDLISPDALMSYGLLLKNMGLYDQARQVFLKYSTVDQVLSAQYAESCNVAKEILAKPATHKIDILEASSRNVDFGVAFFNNNIVYSSARTDLKRDFNQKDITRGADIFVSYTKSNEELTRISFLRPDLKSTRNVGGLSYSNGKVAYTKNAFSSDILSFDGNRDMSIAFGDVMSDLGDWENEQAFAYNHAGSASAFPFLTEQGNVMYFASNRPGGYGGFDIYVSRKINGSWSEPTNLGATVNTPGNEITPFVAANTLYFSSDYHYGLGGYDVFGHELASNTVSNLGVNINSPLDDYFYAIDANTTYAYVTSNRIGGKGKEDIYVLTPYNEDVFAYNEIPAALDLNELVQEAPEVSKDNALAVKNGSNIVERISAVANNYFSMEGATKIVEQPMTNIVYFIQLASFTKASANLSKYRKLNNLGDVIKVHKGYSTKIRIGYFYSKDAAAQKLEAVKSRGFRDAFVVSDDLNSLDMEVIASNSRTTTSTSTSTTSTTTTSNTYSAVTPGKKYVAPANVGNYKIRLASYTDPLWFDVGSVKDIGELEQWTKGEYTIFVLSGYASLTNAKSALIKAKNRGFKDAHIVQDQNGYLEKVTQN